MATLLCVAQLLVPMSAMASTAQTPTRVPEIGEAVTVYTKANMVLDFSSYVFSTMDSAGMEQSGGIRGLTNVMKIWVATTDQQQFTAYCLDMNRHYPAAISDTGEQALYVRDTDALLALFVQTLKNDTAANGSDPNTSACFGDLMAVHGDITSFRFLSTTAVDQTMLDDFNNDERVQFKINGATFADGYELTWDNGHWIYGFWRKTMAQTDNFITTAWPSGAAYDKMLWVVEHSYPAISMDAMMHDAGADYDRLYTEIAASQGGLSSAELDELVETIVYATIQEAIWHHQPAKVNDDPERYIGAQLIQGHQDTKLLYAYLTRERDEYDGYRNKVFGTNIAIEHPADLTPVQNGAGYIYGPFSVSSDMLSAGTIEMSVDADGVNAGVTDSDGTVLGVVRAGQEFFVRTDARPDAALALKARTNNALTLTRSDRGRMYVHAEAEQAAELQPVGTGGTPDRISADDTLVLPAVAPPIIPGPTGERVSFKKIDADTQAPLDGAVIRVVDGNGATVFQGTTDNGVVSTDVELKYDTDYSYFEVTAPDGYELDKTWHTLRLSSTGSNPEYWTLTNEKRPAPPPVTGEARIRKLGADTGAGISGCKIEVKTASGTVVGQYTTDNDGYAVIAGLAPGSYTYKELQAPPCYLLDQNEYTFMVSDTGEVTGTLSFSNARITTSVPIKKVDDKGNPLAGATIPTGILSRAAASCSTLSRTGTRSMGMLHFRSLMNDYHLKDLSGKIKSVLHAKMRSGQYIAAYAPYGYRKSAEDRHQLVIDEEAAAVVRRMFELRRGGMAYGKIAAVLNSEGILSPRWYWVKRYGNGSFKYANLWMYATVKNILTNEVYTGNLIQNQTGSRSYKDSTMICKPEPEWIRHEEAHEAIISPEVWAAVQEVNRERALISANNALPKPFLFTGKLICADCKAPLQGNRETRRRKNGTSKLYVSYFCSHYTSSGHGVCSRHTIYEMTLAELVMGEIRSHAEKLELDEAAVLDRLQRQRSAASAERMEGIRQEITKLRRRIFELEQSTSKLYEDKVCGVITPAAFSVLMQKSEQERLQKTERLDALLSETQQQEQEAAAMQRWSALIRKHLHIRELDRDTVDELIDRIEVGESAVVDGKRVRDIRIFYRFIGNV